MLHSGTEEIMDKTKIFGLIFTGIIICAVFMSGCTSQQQTGGDVQKPAAGPAEDAIKIGVIASMSGPASTTGKDIWQSAELAANEINAAGGIYVKETGKNLSVQLVQGDDESTREGGMKAVSKLITQDNVDLLVGGYSSAVVSAHQATVAENKVPYIIAGGSSTSISNRKDLDNTYLFYHRPNTDDSAEACLLFLEDVVRPAINKKFGFAEDRPLRIALIFQDSPFGKGQQSAVNNITKEKNLPFEIVAEESFKMGESDFRTALTSIKSKNPDVIYSVTFLNELIPLTQQARRDVGLTTLILSIENNDDPDYYKGVGEYGEYTVMESRFSPYVIPPGVTKAKTEKFLDDFEKKYSGFAGMMGAATYESVYIAKNAIENAGTLDKAKVADSLKAISMESIMEVMKGGKITFNPDNHESEFELFVSQLAKDAGSGEQRPYIVWPESLKQSEFVLPDWYKPGTA
jgi:branched-chain amino acid transport system substrate-binding protein